jgi:transcriptional regulator with XRE-family HTH domain
MANPVEPAEIMELRKRHGLTQKEFGALLGYSDRSIKAWESGETSPPPSLRRTLLAVEIELCIGKVDEKSNPLGALAFWARTVFAVRQRFLPLAHAEAAVDSVRGELAHVNSQARAELASKNLTPRFIGR